jgi:pimeloyl-ACP methyl ester carboxylesterase
MRYFVGGRAAGEPIVLVHGLGGAASNWALLAPLLAERHRVLVPELPGHGGSSPLPVVPNLSVFADRIARIADRERFLPGAVVGHSLGGVVALRLALRRKQEVTALVLAGAAGISSTKRRARYSLRVLGVVQPGKLIAPYRRTFERSALLRYVAFGRWGAADPQAMAPEAAEGFLAGPALHTDTPSAARALVRDDPRSELADLHAPTLVLWGARDHQLPVEDAYDYARRLGASLRVIADCGHLLIGERPDACADAIESFLGGAARR